MMPGWAHARGVQLIAAESGVVALDPPNGSQQRPVDVACSVGCTDQRGGCPVGLQSADRDAVVVEGHGRCTAGKGAYR